MLIWKAIRASQTGMYTIIAVFSPVLFLVFFFPFLTVPIPSENFLLSDTKVMLRFFSVKKLYLWQK